MNGTLSLKMGAPNLQPIFVRANMKFTFRGQDYSYRHEGVSVYGASGLHSPHFDPTEAVGEKVSVMVDVLAAARFTFTTTATLTAEATIDAVYLGLKFKLTEAVKNRLSIAIKTEGYYPTNYMRKYPRIPASDEIPTMPMRAILTSGEDEELVVFDIANMSPAGILLYTENPRAALMIPSIRVSGQVEPRGGNLNPFDFTGLVCRMMIERLPGHENIRRYLGIKFTYIPEDHKLNFLDILKSVLDNIQNQGLAR